MIEKLPTHFQPTSNLLPTYFRATIEEAEHCAARAELGTGHSYAVTKTGRAPYRIAPSRVVSAGSAAVNGFKKADR